MQSLNDAITEARRQQQQEDLAAELRQVNARIQECEQELQAFRARVQSLFTPTLTDHLSYVFGVDDDIPYAMLDHNGVSVRFRQDEVWTLTRIIDRSQLSRNVPVNDHPEDRDLNTRSVLLKLDEMEQVPTYNYIVH